VRQLRASDHQFRADSGGLRRTSERRHRRAETRLVERDSAQPRAEGEGFEPSRGLHL
jgi:hypothetical protein